MNEVNALPPPAPALPDADADVVAAAAVPLDLLPLASTTPLPASPRHLPVRPRITSLASTTPSRHDSYESLPVLPPPASSSSSDVADDEDDDGREPPPEDDRRATVPPAVVSAMARSGTATIHAFERHVSLLAGDLTSLKQMNVTAHDRVLHASVAMQDAVAQWNHCQLLEESIRARLPALDALLDRAERIHARATLLERVVDRAVAATAGTPVPGTPPGGRRAALAGSPSGDATATPSRRRGLVPAWLWGSGNNGGSGTESSGSMASLFSTRSNSSNGATSPRRPPPPSEDDDEAAARSRLTTSVLDPPGRMLPRP
ncbi:hypothetical protein H9P43_008443 [Blastocladiella emersonii ATCC 22665]|nr:hypothetical protein H9P43_008443 [Blastocladiella emersonii ATCC 22665]